MMGKEFRAITNNDLPPELRTAFERTGPGCIAAETNIGIVHVCHASDRDIAGFANKSVWNRWELALMPTAPVLRLNLTIIDQPQNPFRYESFLNIGDPDQGRVLDRLLHQEKLYLSFYGNGFGYRFTKAIEHDAAQRAQLSNLVAQATAHWQNIPAIERDFDRAKIEFQRYFPL